MRISVVLPQPDGPSKHVTSDSGKAKVTSSTATTSLKVLVSPSTRISAMGGRRPLPDPRPVRREKHRRARVEPDHCLVAERRGERVMADHTRQRRAAGFEVDDLLPTQILAQEHPCLGTKLPGCGIGGVQSNALRPDADLDRGAVPIGAAAVIRGDWELERA